jgi:hypothetical protein
MHMKRQLGEHLSHDIRALTMGHTRIRQRPLEGSITEIQDLVELS